MSQLSNISEKYINFYTKCGLFAVSPYYLLIKGIVKETDLQSPQFIKEALTASVVCSLLSFIVPVLPLLTSLTMTLASFVATVAVMTMFISYPIALIQDCVEPNALTL